MKSPKFVMPKSLDKVDEMLKARQFPIYLTMEEVSHIILAVEYVDQSEYCDNDILDRINAKLGSALASHYLGDM